MDLKETWVTTKHTIVAPVYLSPRFLDKNRPEYSIISRHKSRLACVLTHRDIVINSNNSLDPIYEELDQVYASFIDVSRLHRYQVLNPAGTFLILVLLRVPKQALKHLHDVRIADEYLLEVAY